jgi:thiol-disulfide isomerase/thioredoxin
MSRDRGAFRPVDRPGGRWSPRAVWLASGVAVVVVLGMLALVGRAMERARSGAVAGRAAASATASGGGGTGQPSPAVQIGGPAGATVGKPSPRIAWPTLTGGVFRLPAGRPAIVYFMAAWCSDCQPEAQALGQLQRQVGDHAAILAVDADPVDQPAQTRAFFHTAGDPGYAIARDHNGRLAGAFALRALDTTVVIDARGQVVYRDEVPTGLPTLESALARAGRA